MRRFLIDNGLKVAGLGETQADRDAASRGCLSRQLRSDWTHLNSYGYFAQALGVYEKGVELGYWPYSLKGRIASWADLGKPLP